MKKVFEGDHVLVVEESGWQFVERKSAKEAVAVVAQTDDGKIILTEQFRQPVRARVIDFPAGLIGDEKKGEEPEEAARKELQEEAGFACDSLELIARGPSSPGITSEIVSLYRAHGARREGEGGGVGGEDIAVHLVAPAELRSWLAKKTDDGVLIDLKLWGGLYFLGLAD